jgi:two-component system phosphate regulon sensor histidine kinase PhoR
MAIDDSSSSSFFSPWPDRLRHSAIILIAAGMALAALVTFGELSPIRAAAVFACIAAAALVPWRLHNVSASREDVRGVNPVESAAVSAIVAGMPDPAVLLDRAGRVIHLNAAAAHRRCAGTNSRNLPCARPKSSRRCAKLSRPPKPGARPISITCRSIAGWN